jgi:hypothetical protein
MAVPPSLEGISTEEAVADYAEGLNLVKVSHDLPCVKR